MTPDTISSSIALDIDDLDEFEHEHIDFETLAERELIQQKSILQMRREIEQRRDEHRVRDELGLDYLDWQ